MLLFKYGNLQFQNVDCIIIVWTFQMKFCETVYGMKIFSEFSLSIFYMALCLVISSEIRAKAYHLAIFLAENCMKKKFHGGGEVRP